MADEPDDIDTLKQKLADADAERAQLLERSQQAEREATEAKTKLAEAGGRVQQNELDIVKGGIETLKTTRDILKAKKREARAAGNDDEVDALDEQLTDAAVKLHRLEEGRAILEVQAQSPRTAPGMDRPFMSLTRAEKVERIASGLTPKAGAWVRAHPDFAQTPEQVNAMVAAHQIAVGIKGLISDTDEYFADIEKQLGITSAARKEPEPAAADATSMAGTATQRRDAPPPAAPASRSSGNGSLARHLSPDEVEMAQASGLTPEEYAENKEALAKEGRLGTKH